MSTPSHDEPFDTSVRDILDTRKPLFRFVKVIRRTDRGGEFVIRSDESASSGEGLLVRADLGPLANPSHIRWDRVDPNARTVEFEFVKDGTSGSQDH